jgi:hypothetical protein
LQSGATTADHRDAQDAVRPALPVKSVETLSAAFSVSFMSRSSPVRKFGAAAVLVARLAIIFDWQQGSRI